jgi:hypothetical protein
MRLRAECRVDGPLDLTRRTIPVQARLYDPHERGDRDAFVAHVTTRSWVRPGLLRLDLTPTPTARGREWDQENRDGLTIGMLPYVELVTSTIPGRIPRLEMLRCLGCEIHGGCVELQPIPSSPRELAPTLPPRPVVDLTPIPLFAPSW